MFKDKTLWIIGANSDIALSFAARYSDQFGKTVLASRNAEKLSAEAQKLKIKNAEVFKIDLNDQNSVDEFLKSAPAPYGVIFFAGHIEYSGNGENNSIKNITETVTVNYLRPVIMIEKISAVMQAEKQGFIALASSAGEARGKYSNRFYVSSKKAASVYLEGMMQENEKHGIKTVVVKFGHVDTKMLKKLEGKRKPIFVSTPQSAADFLFGCIKRGKSTVRYYRPMWKLLAAAYAALPLSIYNRLDV